MSDPIRILTSAIITLVICALGLVGGNVLCAAVLFSKHMPRSSYTYLLQDLTISDTCLLALSSIRTLDHLGVRFLGNDKVTATVVFFWDWISTSATKYFTVAVSLERFFVITFPLKAHAILTPKRSRNAARLVFLFCILLSCFSYAYVSLIGEGSFNVYVAIVLHFLPFSLVLVLNVLIFIGLRKIQHENQQLRKSGQQQRDEDYSITKMLFTVVLVFGICYSFEFVRRLMNFMWHDYMTKYTWNEYTINNLADIFYVLNSSSNFVIYCVLGKRFRAVFCKVFQTDRLCGIGNEGDDGKRGRGDGKGKGSEEGKTSTSTTTSTVRIPFDN